jgi:hypothetical protein
MIDDDAAALYIIAIRQQPFLQMGPTVFWRIID